MRVNTRLLSACVLLVTLTATHAKKNQDAFVCPSYTNYGCKPFSGVTEMVVPDSKMCAADGGNCYAQYCPTGKCQTLFYGGEDGQGDNTQQNKWGKPKPWSQLFTIPLKVSQLPTIVNMSVSINATAASGYANPSPLPFMMNITVNGNQVAHAVQLDNILRNSYHLKQKPQDMNYRVWTYFFPASVFSPVASTEVNITWSLITNEWVAFQGSWLNVYTCNDECECKEGSEQNGYWTGSQCDKCQRGFSGPLCNYDITHDHLVIGSYGAAVGVLSVICSVLVGIICSVNYKISAMNSLGGEQRPLFNAGDGGL